VDCSRREQSHRRKRAGHGHYAGFAEAVNRKLLRDLERGLGPAVSSSTLATVRAGFLASHGLIHNARHTLLLALRPDSATLTIGESDARLQQLLPPAPTSLWEQQRFPVDCAAPTRVFNPPGFKRETLSPSLRKRHKVPG